MRIVRIFSTSSFIFFILSISKLKSTKMADEVIYNCLQFLGGYGYIEDYPMARLSRDSRLGPIGGGTSEILKEILAKIIVDKKEYKKHSV